MRTGTGSSSIIRFPERENTSKSYAWRWPGGRVNYDGRFYRLQRFRMGVQPVQERIPIYVASLGQRNLELTGELADGWLPIWTHNEKLPSIKEHLVAALRESGRQDGDMTTAPQILCCASDDEETVSNAVRQARAHMAFYIGGMGQYYYGPVLPIWLPGRGRRGPPCLGRGGSRRSGQGDHR